MRLTNSHVEDVSANVSKATQTISLTEWPPPPHAAFDEVEQGDLPRIPEYATRQWLIIQGRFEGNVLLPSAL